MKKNFFYNLILTVSGLLFPLLTFPYLSRILGADGLGISNFIISYGQNYTIVAALGLPIYGIREISKVGDDKKKRSTLFFELFTIHLIFTSFLLLLYFVSIFSFDDLRNYKNLAILGSSMIFFNVFSIEWLFAGVNTFKYITIRSLIIRCLSVIAIFVFVRKSGDLFIYVLITVITMLITVMMDVYYAKNFISRQIALSLKGILSHIETIVFLGVYIVLTSIYAVLPTTLLGFLGTKTSVGYYYGANRIIRMVISIFSALTTVMIPRLNMAIEKPNNDEYHTLINKSLNIVISFGIPITTFVFLLANPLVMVLAGKAFINSVFVIQIMSPIILIVAFAQVFVFNILSVHRRDKHMVLLSIIGMVLSIIINLIFIPQYEERATGVSQLCSELLVTTVSFFLARKIFKFAFPVKNFILNILCMIPFIIIIHYSKQVFDSDVIIIISSSFLCGLYFIFYQVQFIKNPLFLEITKPFLLRMRNI